MWPLCPRADYELTCVFPGFYGIQRAPSDSYLFFFLCTVIGFMTSTLQGHGPCPTGGSSAVVPGAGTSLCVLRAHPAGITP